MHDGVKLYIGLVAYRIGTGDGGANDQAEWQSGDNLARMIDVVNANPNIDGYAIYSYNSLFDKTEYGDIKTAETKAVTEKNHG